MQGGGCLEREGVAEVAAYGGEKDPYRCCVRPFRRLRGRRGSGSLEVGVEAQVGMERIRAAEKAGSCTAGMDLGNLGKGNWVVECSPLRRSRQGTRECRVAAA